MAPPAPGVALIATEHREVARVDWINISLRSHVRLEEGGRLAALRDFIAQLNLAQVDVPHPL